MISPDLTPQTVQKQMLFRKAHWAGNQKEINSFFPFFQQFVTDASEKFIVLRSFEEM